MRTGDTILALSSPPGRSARAILRLSGPAVAGVLGEFCRPVPSVGAGPSALRLDGGASLPVLVARFAAPRSYTGEDAAEVLLPGNPQLVERVSRLFQSAEGVRAAAPGEFTARAYLNHKLTLEQAEGVALTIAADGEAELAAARRLVSGAAGEVYARWSEELAMLLALVEAGIDFTDQEDVVPIAARALRSRLAALRDDMELRSGSRRGRREPSGLPLVVLAGEPNAGKSTLFNALLGRRRAVAGPEPGTTRDLLAEDLDLSRDAPGAGVVVLADVAGLAPGGSGGAPGGVEAQAAAQAVEAVGRADVVVHCDPSGRFGGLPETGASVVRVRTKADLPRAPGPGDALPVCALDGRNLSALRSRIAVAVRGCSAGAEAILAPRHRAAVGASMSALAEAEGMIDPAGPGLAAPELVAGLLRAALDALGELTGRITPDDILGRVFGTFCIGK